MKGIQIGEYGKTNLGKIIKFAWIENSEGQRYENKVILIKNNKLLNKFYYFGKNEYIIKHSKNVIDIIEVNDYANGERVIQIFNSKFLGFGELPYIITENSKLEEQDIQTILTHEQYENNCYRIGE